MALGPTDGTGKLKGCSEARALSTGTIQDRQIAEEIADAYGQSTADGGPGTPVAKTERNELAIARTFSGKEIRPHLPDTVHVMQGEGGRLSASDPARAIGTYGLRSCSAVFLWNEDSKETWCFHLANRSDLDHFEQMVHGIIAEGRWKVVLAAGSQLGHEQEQYGGRAYNHRLLSMLANTRDPDRVTFEAIARSGGESSVEHDRAFICERKTGEIFEVDNTALVAIEAEEPENLGPEAKMRWVCANLFPAFDSDHHPTILAYDGGAFTGELHSARSEDLSQRMGELEARMRTSADDQTIAGWLEELFPENAYLRQRLTTEPEFVEYMADALRSYFEP